MCRHSAVVSLLWLPLWPMHSVWGRRGKDEGSCQSSGKRIADSTRLDSSSWERRGGYVGLSLCPLASLVHLMARRKNSSLLSCHQGTEKFILDQLVSGSHWDFSRVKHPPLPHPPPREEKTNSDTLTRLPWSCTAHWGKAHTKGRRWEQIQAGISKSGGERNYILHFI